MKTILSKILHLLDFWFVETKPRWGGKFRIIREIDPNAKPFMPRIKNEGEAAEYDSGYRYVIQKFLDVGPDPDFWNTGFSCDNLQEAIKVTDYLYKEFLAEFKSPEVVAW